MKTKTVSIKNDGTLHFHIIKHIKSIADSKNFEDFSCWFVQYIIFPYSDKKDFLNSIYQSAGFKKEPNFDKLYIQLKNASLDYSE